MNGNSSPTAVSAPAAQPIGPGLRPSAVWRPAQAQEQHHQGLGDEVLGEPAGVEHRLVVETVGAVEGEGEDAEGGEVGDGVEGAEADDEAQQVARAEHGRAAEHRGVGAVVGEGELGDVEAQVLCQHLGREHRQIGQEE